MARFKAQIQRFQSEDDKARKPITSSELARSFFLVGLHNGSCVGCNYVGTNHPVKFAKNLKITVAGVYKRLVALRCALDLIPPTIQTEDAWNICRALVLSWLYDLELLATNLPFSLSLKNSGKP